MNKEIKKCNQSEWKMLMKGEREVGSEHNVIEKRQRWKVRELQIMVRSGLWVVTLNVR